MSLIQPWTQIHAHTGQTEPAVGLQVIVAWSAWFAGSLLGGAPAVSAVAAVSSPL